MGVRELWTMIIDIGFASKLELDLETAVITVDGDEAEMRIFDDYGDIELAFNFAKRGRQRLAHYRNTARR